MIPNDGLSNVKNHPENVQKLSSRGAPWRLGIEPFCLLKLVGSKGRSRLKLEISHRTCHVCRFCWNNKNWKELKENNFNNPVVSKNSTNTFWNLLSFQVVSSISAKRPSSRRFRSLRPDGLDGLLWTVAHASFFCANISHEQTLNTEQNK